MLHNSLFPWWVSLIGYYFSDLDSWYKYLYSNRIYLSWFYIISLIGLLNWLLLLWFWFLVRISLFQPDSPILIITYVTSFLLPPSPACCWDTHNALPTFCMLYDLWRRFVPFSLVFPSLGDWCTYWNLAFVCFGIGYILYLHLHRYFPDWSPWLVTTLTWPWQPVQMTFSQCSTYDYTTKFMVTVLLPDLSIIEVCLFNITVPTRGLTRLPRSFSILVHHRAHRLALH